jgi:hypothetical protein
MFVCTLIGVSSTRNLIFETLKVMLEFVSITIRNCKTQLSSTYLNCTTINFDHEHIS